MKKSFCLWVFVSGIQILASQNVDGLKNGQHIFTKGEYHFDTVAVQLQEGSGEVPASRDVLYIDHDSGIRSIGNPHKLDAHMNTLFETGAGADFNFKVIGRKSYQAIVKNAILSLKPIDGSQFLSFTIDLEANLLKVGDKTISLCEKREKVSDSNNIFKSEWEGVVWEIDPDINSKNDQEFPFEKFYMKVLKIKDSNKMYIDIKAGSPSGGNMDQIRYKLLSSAS